MSIYAVHTSEAARWHALLTAAEAEAQSCLGRELESYVVFMLLRYVGRPELAGTSLALEYLESLLATGRIQHENLHDVGDQCLLFTGLFPEHAERQHVPVSYFVKLGRTAYQYLAADGDPLFATLSARFVHLMDVLQIMRELGDGHPCLDPIAAYNLWLDTGSPHAWRTLTEGLPATPVAVASAKIH